MSATEQLLERVKGLDEEEAKTMLDLLDTLPPKTAKAKASVGGPVDVYAMIGYAKKYNPPYKTTAEWMTVLREGEAD